MTDCFKLTESFKTHQLNGSSDDEMMYYSYVKSSSPTIFTLTKKIQPFFSSSSLSFPSPVQKKKKKPLLDQSEGIGHLAEKKKVLLPFFSATRVKSAFTKVDFQSDQARMAEPQKRRTLYTP